MKLLNKKLAKAIEGENFEAAALLRDEIKQLTGREGGSVAT
jgi:protein-arginine kinase activator protein McsA